MIRVVLPIITVVYGIVIALNCMGQLVVKPVDPPPVFAQRVISTEKTVQLSGATLTAKKTASIELFEVGGGKSSGGKLQESAIVLTNTTQTTRSFPLMFVKGNRHSLTPAKKPAKKPAEEPTVEPVVEPTKPEKAR